MDWETMRFLETACLCVRDAILLCVSDNLREPNESGRVAYITQTAEDLAELRIVYEDNPQGAEEDRAKVKEIIKKIVESV